MTERALFLGPHTLILSFFTPPLSPPPPPPPHPHTADVPPGCVIIVGAGIAGLATALALHRVGIPALVLEAGPAPRREGASISLWTNGFKALDYLGVGEAVRRGGAVPGGAGVGSFALDGVTLMTAGGNVLTDVDYAAAGGGPHEARGVLRGELMAALAGPLPPGTVRYSSPVLAAAAVGDGAVVVLGEAGGGAGGSTAPSPPQKKRVELRCRAVVGADGVRSSIAGALGLGAPAYAGYTAYRGVAAFEAPATAPASLASIATRPRVLFGNGVRAGVVPLGGGRWYWFVTENEPPDARRVSDPEAVRALALAAVSSWAPTTGVGAAIAASPPHTLTKSRVVDRLGRPWAPAGGWAPAAGGGGGGGRSPGPVTLVGDAAHPTTPNLAQGGGLGLEDAVVLARCLAGATPTDGRTRPSPADDAAALRSFEAQRAGRAFFVTLKSRLIGLVGQVSGPPPILAVRDFIIAKGAGNEASLLGHTMFDVGPLPAPVVARVSGGKGGGRGGGGSGVVVGAQAKV